MFDDARNDLTEVLRLEQRPLSLAEAREALDVSALKAEAVVNQTCETETVDGTTYVLGIADGPSFDPEMIDGYSDDDTEAAESDAAPEEDEAAQDPQPDVEAVQDASAGSDDDSDDEDIDEIAPDDLHRINGVLMTADPDEEIVGDWIGEEWYGLPVLEDGRDDTPNETTPYFPVEVTGDRDSEESMGKVLGEMNRPLLWEGEAGTGKNRAISRALAATNRPVQRINFGADLSVFDLIGEKDFIEGVGSVFILGKLAKAGLFGHTAIFDEVNMAAGDVTSFLHAATEEPGDREIDLRGTDITLRDIPVSEEAVEAHGSWYEAARAKWNRDDHLGVYIHPEFRVTATCNPLDYADTKSMNDAFRDRFVVLEHDYLDLQQECRLLGEETGVDEADVRPLVRLANTLRAMKKEANALTCPITHRSLLKTVEFAGADESFMTFREAALNVMVEHASTKQDKEKIRDAIEDEL